jgi:hypothetical protein
MFVYDSVANSVNLHDVFNNDAGGTWYYPKDWHEMVDLPGMYTHLHARSGLIYYNNASARGEGATVSNSFDTGVQSFNDPSQVMGNCAAAQTNLRAYVFVRTGWDGGEPTWYQGTYNIAEFDKYSTTFTYVWPVDKTGMSSEASSTLWHQTCFDVAEEAA